MYKFLVCFLLITFLSLASCKSADGFHFEKVVFHSSACFGFCPSYHLEVKSDQSMRLKGDSIYGKRSGNATQTKVGYFTARANDSLYKKLLTELRTIGLDTLQFKSPNCCDGSVKTIIVYYNGKRKYLKAMFPPDHAHTLIATLTDLYSLSDWKTVKDNFTIEQDSIAR